MQGGPVALDALAPDFFASRLSLLRRRKLGLGERLPHAEPNPRPLLLASPVDIKQAHGLAILLEFVLNLAAEGKWRRLREVDAAILQYLAVVYADRDEAASLGMTFGAGPLHYCD
jgi:hypothetical protein